MIRLTTGTFKLLLGVVSRVLFLAKNDMLLNILMISFLFICIYTSSDWSHISAAGEIFRFDRVMILGQISLFYVYSGIFFVIIFLRKFVHRIDRNVLREKNYLINILWIYFIPVNLLIYFTIYLKDITVNDLGVIHIVRSFVYLSVAYYIQDVYLANKDRIQLRNIITGVQIILFTRCFYSIVKYFLGFGHSLGGTGLGRDIYAPEGVLRLGQENDFADFFILLFIIALTRLLFDENRNRYMRLFHVLSVIASSYISIMSLRRYTWGEYLVAGGLILFFHYRVNKEGVYKKIISVSFIIVIMLGGVLYIGPGHLKDNYFTGRLISVLSLIDEDFATEYGSDTGHVDEIVEGWHNVKKHWLLGVSPFGEEILERDKTSYQKSMFVHNAYLLIWLQFGFLGFILYVFLYLKSIRLGYMVFMKYQENIGLILLTFMIAQMVKNIVWATAIILINETVIYILLISIALKSRQLQLEDK